jgi:putative hemolysin
MTSFAKTGNGRSAPETCDDDSAARRLVDDMIMDRAPSLAWSPWSPLYRWLVERMIGYRDLVAIVDQCRRCRSGIELADLILRKVSPKVTSANLHHMPAVGGCILAANHPTGIVDGVALYHQIRGCRRDVSILAFHDVININPAATDVFVPVEWRASRRDATKTLYTMACTTRALSAGRAVAIFPSGRLAFWNGLQLCERPWKSTFVSLAIKYDVPIIPVHIAARNSLAFYALSQISTELRDICSIREFQNKNGAPYAITFGRPVRPHELDSDPEAIAAQLQFFVEHVLPKAPDAIWDSREPSAVEPAARGLWLSRRRALS